LRALNFFQNKLGIGEINRYPHLCYIQILCYKTGGFPYHYLPGPYRYDIFTN
jgi:hypothetical protein